MMDTLTREERSQVMAKVRGKGTKPEMAVRRLVHSLGYRYRLHATDLPGKPDLVFRPRKKVIFVHGCFWHRHRGCQGNRMPKSRISFWRTKLEGNKKRDIMNKRRLTRLGWEYLVIWECEVSDMQTIKEKVISFLEEDG